MKTCKPFWVLGDLSVKHPLSLLKRQKSYTTAWFLHGLQVLEGIPDAACPGLYTAIHRLPARASSSVGCTNRSLEALNTGASGVLVLCWGLHLALTHAMSSSNRSPPAALKQAKYKQLLCFNSDFSSFEKETSQLICFCHCSKFSLTLRIRRKAG